MEFEMGKVLPQVIRQKEGVTLDMPGGGYGKRMVGGPISQNIGMGIIYVERGKSPHRWHTHDSADITEAYEIHYPKGFEEVYMVIQGEGVVQWKEGEEMKEERVGTGDAIYFPPGVVENQVFNNGHQPLIIVYGLTPLPKFKAG